MSNKDHRSTTLLSYTTKQFTNGVNVLTRTGFSNVPGTGFTRSGTNTKGWKRLIKDGKSATNSFDASTLELTSHQGSDTSSQGIGTSKQFRFTYVGDDYLQNNTYPRYHKWTIVPAGVMASIDNQAREKAYRQVAIGINSTTVVGEILKTANMIRSPALALRKAVAKYQQVAFDLRKHARHRHDFVKAISDTWLEYSYGWKPLMGDVVAGAEAFAASMDSDRFKPFKGTFRQKYSAATAGINTAATPYVDLHISVDSVSECSVSYYGKARAGSGSNTASSHAARFGTGMPSFVPAAWELMPYSFLIDYFSNIGTVLDSYATYQYTDFCYCARTTRIETNTHNNVIAKTGNPSYILTNNQQGFANWKSLSVQRRATSAIPLPHFELRFKVGLSQGLNIAALLLSKLHDAKYRKRK